MPRTEVLFYQESDAVVLVDQWLNRLPPKVQDKCGAYLSQLEEYGHELRRPVADYLRDGIYELRPSFQGVHYRILYFFYDSGKGKPGIAKSKPNVVVISHLTDSPRRRVCLKWRSIGRSNGRRSLKPTPRVTLLSLQ